ncbi:MAG: ABC transporter ATP-binding protein [Clostridia bacterium]|nr:ABC transporter ATP-binding protein [Clostridia bacterium]
MRNKNKGGKLKRFLSYYRPHMPLFITDMLCALLMAGIGVAYPMATKLAIERYLPGKLYGAFAAVMGACFAAYVLYALLQFIVTSIGHRLGVLMEADMRRDVFSHLQTLDFTFFNNARTGVLLSRCTSDLFEITELAHHGPEDVFISIMTFLGAFCVMLTIEWRLALVLLVSVPALLGIVVLLRKRMSQASRRVKEGMAGVNADIESSLSGMRVAQAFANEQYEIDKFVHGNQKYVNARTDYFKIMGAFFASMEFFTNILSVLVIAAGGYMIMRGSMDVVALMTFTLYVASFTRPIQKLTQFTEIYTMGMSGFSRFCELMDIQPAIKDAPEAADIGAVRGDITFENVSFSYKDRDDNPCVLRDVDIAIPAGRTVAVVGPSGSGKTTLCHLVPRFFEPDKGRVLIDGRDIAGVTLHSLRANIGIVQQDVFLFADTIFENIRYGRLDATREEVIEAAKAAKVHEDIMAMPDGYDTHVGERGVTLSGGQKQRISIARIFLKNPPILILDEATSALDSATEADITQELTHLSRGRTTLTIAHRLSTVRNADEIIVIAQGRIAERGAHEALLAQGGAYSRLYNAQYMQ